LSLGGVGQRCQKVGSALSLHGLEAHLLEKGSGIASWTKVDLLTFVEYSDFVELLAISTQVQACENSLRRRFAGTGR
jgi:hypothetical protein